MVRVLLSFLYIWAFVPFGAFANTEAPQVFTYSGRLYDDSDAPLNKTVTFRLQIYNQAGTCLLYEESQVINLQPTAGRFALEVGSKTSAGKRTSDDPGFAMWEIFKNSGSLSPAASVCPITPFSPSAGEKRILRVHITPAGGVEEQLTPDQTITSAPSSMMSQSLQGVGKDGFVQVSSNITQANVEALVDGSDASSLHDHDSTYAKLSGSGSMSLASDSYLGFGQVADGAAQTTLTTGWGATEKGRTWFRADTNQIMYWDGSSAQAVGSAGAGIATINGDSTSGQSLAIGSSGTAPAWSTAAGTHTLDIPMASTAGVTAGLISKTEYDSFNSKMASGDAAGGDLTGTYPNPTIANDAVTSAMILDGQVDTADLASESVTLAKLADEGSGGQSIRRNAGDTAWEYYTPASALGYTPVNKAGDNMTGNLTMDTQSEVRFADAAGGDYISLKAPTGVTTYDLTLPATVGNANDVLQTDASGNLSWVAIPSAPVTQVFGRTGSVVAATSDYDAVQIDNTAAGNIAATNVQAAIDELDSEKVAKAGDTMTGALSMGASNANLSVSDTASLPAHTWTDDPNTGLFNPAADEIGISTAGTEKLRIDSAGNVGIGTTNPVVPLSIQKNIDNSATTSYLADAHVEVRNIGAISDGSTTFIRTEIGDGDGHHFGSVWHANNDVDFEIRSENTGSGTDTTRFTIEANGNVGIGTTTPGRQIEVVNSALGGTVVADFNQTGTTANAFSAVDITQTSATDSLAMLRFNNDGDAWSIGIDGSDGDKFKISDSLNTTFTNPIMTIDKTGKVGIGTTSPAGELEIEADGSARLFMRSYGASQVSNFLGYSADGTQAAPTAVTAGSDLAKFGGRGHDGTNWVDTSRAIMNIEADETWTSTGQGTHIEFFTTTTGTTSTTEKMRISHDGNVGIGTTTPATKLDVNGTVTATAFAGDGSGLTGISAGSSNSSSNASNYVINTDSDASGADGGLNIQSNGTNLVTVENSGTTNILSGDLDVESAAGTADIKIDSAASNDSSLSFAQAGTTEASIRYDDGDDALVLTDGANSDTLTIKDAKVGIGVTAPTEKLDVNGGIRSRVTDGLIFSLANETTAIGAPTADGMVFLYDANLFGAGTDGMIFEKTDFNGADPDGGIMFANRGNDGVRDPSLVIRGSGNVGIGVTNPSVKLDVAGDLYLDDRLKISRSTVSPNIILENSNFGGGNAWFAYYDTGSLLMATDNTERMRITSIGRVGIGTSSPSNNLHVTSASGAVSAKVESFGGAPTLHLERNNGTSAAPSAVQASDDLGFLAGSGYGATATFPGSAAKVGFLAAENWTDATGAAHMIFSTRPSGTTSSATERMRIDKDGNVGIGTTTPSTALEVNGTVTATAFAGDGSNLTGISADSSDASANTGNYVINTDSDGSGADGGLNIQSNGTNLVTIENSGTMNVLSGDLDVESAAGAADIKIDSAASNDSSLSFAQAGTTEASIRYDDGDDALVLTDGANSDTLFIKDGKVGIGESSPTTRLHISEDGSHALTRLESFSGTSTFELASSNGSKAAPTATQISDYLGQVVAIGRGATSIIPGSAAKIMMGASENWTDSTAAAHMTFHTRPSGTTAGSSERMRIDKDGNVGIGTSTPGYQLDVAGYIRGVESTGSGLTAPSWGSNLILDSNTSVGMTFLTGDNTSSASILFGDPEDVNVGSIIYAHASDDMKFIVNASERMKINSSGNVGIGVNPLSPLHVSGAIRSSGVGGGGIFVYGTEQETGTPTTDSVRFIYDGAALGASADALVIDKTDGNATNPDGGIVFSNTGTDGVREIAMTIRGSGNVGIGTTNPATPLAINKDVDNSATVSYLNDAILQVGNIGLSSDGGTAFIRSEVGDGDGFHFGSVWHANNDVDFEIRSENTGSGSDTTRFTIESNGHVGIGTSSPAMELDVNGAIASRGQSVITQDATNVVTYIRSKNGTTTQGAGINLYNEDEVTNTNDLFITPGPGGDAVVNGSLGIGTSSPGEMLHVNGNILLKNNGKLSVDGTGELTIGNSVQTLLRFPGNGATSSVLSNHNHLILGTTRSDAADDDIIFEGTRDTGTSTWMTIQGGTGHVGIGTSSPGIVSGSAKYLTVDYGDTAGVTSLELKGRTVSGDSPFSKVDFINYGTTGTNVNIARIEAVTTTANTARGGLSFYTKNLSGFAERVKIDEDGNFGIGVSPAYKLDVDGDINVSSGHSYLTNGADYAEYFEASEEMKSGDVVGLNPKTGLARRYQDGDALLGVVSTQPGMIGNNGLADQEGVVLVALVGQVPFDKNQVKIKDGEIFTFDNKPLGYLLTSGNVYINLSSAHENYQRRISSLENENAEIRAASEAKDRKIQNIEKQLEEQNKRLERLERLISN